jgi:hypothetical protein
VYHLAGTLAYERVPYDHENDGLDYGAIETRPMRGVSVRLLDAETDEELASAVSGEDGSYAFDYEGTARVKLWLFAETVSPPITVEDNTSQDQIYVMESAEVDSAADGQLDVVATSGWSGDGYGGPRLAAPFAVLDAAYTATGRFLAETTPAPVFVALLLNWSVDNRPEGGDKALGRIVTSHWDGAELYILGKADIDTDEFDSHIIVHEWCHAFQTTYTRADSIGGVHSEGDIVDPRVAFSEGSCNAMSAIIFDPDTVYTDSAGPLQAEGFSTDFEVNNTSLESNPGWFAESSVATIVFDLYDGANEPFDQVEVGLQGVYQAMLAQRDAESFSTLFSFVSPLKAEFPDAAADIDELVVYHGADADFGIDAIVDEWGADETHAAGLRGQPPAVPRHRYRRHGDDRHVRRVLQPARAEPLLPHRRRRRPDHGRVHEHGGHRLEPVPRRRDDRVRRDRRRRGDPDVRLGRRQDVRAHRPGPGRGRSAVFRGDLGRSLTTKDE